jgi:hypothetical protein
MDMAASNENCNAFSARSQIARKHGEQKNLTTDFTDHRDCFSNFGDFGNSGDFGNFPDPRLSVLLVESVLRFFLRAFSVSPCLRGEQEFNAQW